MAHLEDEIPISSLEEALGAPISSVEPLGGEGGEKGRGYGAPLLLRLEGRPPLVLHRSRRGGFGREDLADRAHALLLAYETFNDIPSHVRAVGVGAVLPGGALRPLAGVEDFYLLTAFEAGVPYHELLADAASRDVPTEEDVQRVDALAGLLAAIHAVEGTDPERYRRRIRELVGGNECIAGIVDSFDGFPLEPWGDRGQLASIERRCLSWKRRLKNETHRLRRVHGDFHPWNILFDGPRPVLLDRSRGPFGEPADDVSALCLNFLFFSLVERGGFKGAMRALWSRFFESYVEATGDGAIFRVLPPFLCFRALVVASPAWYPNLVPLVRRQLLSLADRVLDLEVFSPSEVDLLLEP